MLPALGIELLYDAGQCGAAVLRLVEFMTERGKSIWDNEFGGKSRSCLTLHHRSWLSSISKFQTSDGK